MAFDGDVHARYGGEDAKFNDGGEDDPSFNQTFPSVLSHDFWLRSATISG